MSCTGSSTPTMPRWSPCSSTAPPRRTSPWTRSGRYVPLCGSQCFVSGMSALVTDLKDLCEEGEACIRRSWLCCCAMCGHGCLSWTTGWYPFVFLASIGVMILFNLGSNYFFGEISYITKALSAVLQLAVTMDYSIFLWHSYNEQRRATGRSTKDAMACAIHATLTSVIGSSVTTVAGFVGTVLHDLHAGASDLGSCHGKGRCLRRYRLRHGSARADPCAVISRCRADAPPFPDSRT